jgi:hypothetical protein
MIADIDEPETQQMLEVPQCGSIEPPHPIETGRSWIGDQYAIGQCLPPGNTEHPQPVLQRNLPQCGFAEAASTQLLDQPRQTARVLHRTRHHRAIKV